MFKIENLFKKLIEKIGPLLIILCFMGKNMNANENPILVEKKARFTVICAECIRLEYSDNGKFIDNKSLFAINRDVGFSDFKLQKEKNRITIETTRFKLIYQSDGKSFSSKNLKVLVKNGDLEIEWLPGMENKQNLEGTIRTLDQVRGKIPLEDGILARDGWYVYDDSRRPLLTEDWVEQRPLNSRLDWYFFAYSSDYKSALKALTKIGGEIPLPRKYVLGSWYSRYWPYSSDEFRQIVKEYKENDFPLDIMVVDMDWHKDGWTGWSWNRKLLPDAEELLKWFHAQNLKVTLNVHPAEGVGPHEDMYLEFMKDMGVEIKGKPDSSSPVLPYDAANKKYLDNLFKHTHIPLEKLGVDFWWLDWQQFPFTKSNPELKNLEWLNDYYYKHTSKNNQRGQSFSRWGGWGDHKNPIHFSGDAVSIWPMLEFEVPFTASAGNIGCFFWSHDIGGHFGGLEQETNARWVQFGSMTAALRLHSTRDKNMDKRPWLSASMFTESMKKSFHIRSMMFPYIYSSVQQSCNETIPLTRPMYIDYPNKEIAYRNPQQYLFGDNLLVAPIVSPGTGPTKVSSQKVWFPDGVWFNFFTGEKFLGSDNLVSVWAEIYEFPLFVKGGVPVPMQVYTQRMASEPLNNLVVRVYPGEDEKTGEFVLYEDDGISQDYKKEKFAITKMYYKRNGNTHEIKVDPVKGNYEGQPKQRTYVFEIPCTEKVDSALFNGKKVEVKYDKNNSINQIILSSKIPIDQPINISITSKEIDYVALQKNVDLNRTIGITGKMPVEGAVPAGLITASLNEGKANSNDTIISFFSGVSIYKQDNDIFIIKNPSSGAAKDFKASIVDIIGEKEEIYSEERFSLIAGENKLITISNPLKEHFGTISKRVLRLDLKINDKEFTINKEIDQKESYICNWHVLGPFDYDRKKDISDYKYKPETETKTNLKSTYIGKKNKPIKWQKVECTSYKTVDLEKYLEASDCIAYGITHIKSEQEQEVSFDVNSDDGVEIFLNGKKIHSNNVFRAVVHDPDKVTGKLLKGENILLLKNSQGDGGMGFMVKVNCKYPIINY